MIELAFDGQNPDLGLLYNINDLARYMPGWADRAAVFTGQYLLVLAALLVVLRGWRSARRQGARSAAAVAATAWAPLAAGIALLLAVPIRALVQRPRPYVDNEGLDVLVHGGHTYSFVDGRVTLTMAVGVGLYLANRGLGLTGIALAALEGFLRVFMGVDYPTDALGGFALGAATALLLAPAALAVLGPLAEAVGRSRAALLVRAGPPPTAPVQARSRAEQRVGDKDLAA